MNKDIVRAYLWRRIVRLGFSPSKPKEQKSWVYLFVKSLKDFWEVDGYWDAPTKKDGVQLVIRSPAQSNLIIRYSPAGVYDYGATFEFVQSAAHKLVLWKQHSDSSYFMFPEQGLLTMAGPERNALKKIADGDMDAVIDSLICHPQPHQHIEPPMGNKLIRIGGGIDNSFLFLFHLRYQLCPIVEKREAEKRRLVELFQQALKHDKTIPPSDLMAQP